MNGADRSTENRSIFEIAAEETVENFVRMRIRMKLTDTADLSGAAIFVLINRSLVPKTFQKQDRNTRRLRKRRQENNRARDFNFFLSQFGKACDGGTLTSQVDAIRFIEDSFSKHPLLEVQRVHSVDGIRSYAATCFENGDNNVEFWLGRFDTWILAGQSLRQAR